MTSLTWGPPIAATQPDTRSSTSVFNYRLDELRAALGSVQLSRIDGLNDDRARLAARYRDNLADGPFAVPTFAERGRSANHLAVALAPSPEERDRARERLGAARIQTSVHYPPIHRFSYYREGAPALLVAEAIADRVLTLPLHPRLTEGDVDEVCAVLLGS